MMETWTEALGVSRERVLSAARTGRHREALLAHATAGRIVAAWTLDPAPRDPATHVEATHARTRRHLERLREKPAGSEVRSPMTSQLYTRLTQPADPPRRTRIDYTVAESYTYTPRKPLRRVLHHVARSEVLYAGSFDEALPEDPAARYAEADTRLGQRLGAARARAGDPSIVFPDPYGTLFTPADVVAEVIALERELVAQTT